MKLRPYSLYFLYITSAILIIFLVITLVRLFKFKKNLKLTADEIKTIKKNAAEISAKKEYIDHRYGEKLRIVIKGIPYLVVLKAIQKDYNESDGVGVAQYKKSADKILGKKYGPIAATKFTRNF